MSAKRVLLAEDNPNDVELALCALAATDLVGDGEKALDYLNLRGAYSNRPNALPAVALLDIKMPKVSGIDVLERMKKDPRLAGIPVVMLTSSRKEANVLRCYQHGANAYAIKPVDFDEFIKTVKLRRTPRWNSCPSRSPRKTCCSPSTAF
ncbi:MAG: two-component system response regulator [Verrucomicrobiales bacterium]|nr:two-component system response regulator [Verrucomicrobiales bacterium]